MDSRSDKLGRAGAIGLAMAVFGFISLLVMIIESGLYINSIKNLVIVICQDFLVHIQE